PSQTFNMINNADLKFPYMTDKDRNVTELTHGRYHSFMESTDRSVRKSAFEAMHNNYGKFENTFAATLSNEIKTNNVSAKIRKFEYAIHTGLNSNKIPESVHDNL